MKSLIVVLLVLGTLTLQVLSGGPSTYTWQGGESCVENGPPCDFDDISFWSGVTYKPSQTQNSYGIYAYFPSSIASKNYTIVADSLQLKVSSIVLGTSTKRGVEQTAATPTGLKLIFKNCNLTEFVDYTVIDSSKLIFEDSSVQYNPSNGAGTCQQWGNSLVHFKGKTTANVKCNFNYIYTGDTFILDHEATLQNFAPNFISMTGDTNRFDIYLSGTLITNTWSQLNYYGYLHLDGANITTTDAAKQKGLYPSGNFLVGVEGAAVGRESFVTYIEYYFGNAIHQGHSALRTDLVLLDQYNVTIKEGAVVITEDHQNTAYAGNEMWIVSNVSFVISEGGSFVINKNVKWIDDFEGAPAPAPVYRKFDISEGTVTFNLPFNNTSGNLKFTLNDPNALLSFNDNFKDLVNVNGGTIFDLISGSIEIKKNYDGANLSRGGKSPATFVFGDGIIKTPDVIEYTNVYVVSSGATFEKSMYIGDGNFTGHGTIKGDFGIVSSNLNLFSVGTPLIVEGLLQIEDATNVIFGISGSSCGSVQVGNLSIVATLSPSFGIKLQGPAPQQNTTYVVLEYTGSADFGTAGVPTSINPALFTIEHDQANKQIKVHYIYTPQAPPTEPTAPVDSPNSTPSNTPPTNNGNPTPAVSSISAQPSLFLIGFVLLVITVVFFN